MAHEPRGYHPRVRRNFVILGLSAIVAIGALTTFSMWKRSRDDARALVPESATVARVHAAKERIRRSLSRPTRPHDPRRTELLTLLGRGDHARALELSRAIQRDQPDDLESALYEALVLKEMKRYSEAKLALDRVLDGMPEFRKPWTSLYYYGWILFNTGDADGARAAFTTFLEFDPSEGDAYFGLGLLDLDRLDLDGAEARFRKAIELAESGVRSGKSQLVADVAKGKARLGEVMFERERYEAARDLLREALLLEPRSHEAWYLLHRVSKKLGDAAGAAEALARHAATRPTDAPQNP